MTLQELEQIKLRISKEHGIGKDKAKPRVTVGMGSCGIKAGAAGVLEVLKQETGESGETVVTHVGCIGLCSYEPIVEVAIPGQPVATYFHMTPEKAKKVAESHLRDGKPIQEWVLALRSE
jgi:(2Fe-2S) ferredoxin